jgi:hypothetical protein
MLAAPAVVSPTGQSLVRLIEQARLPPGWRAWLAPGRSAVTMIVAVAHGAQSPHGAENVDFIGRIFAPGGYCRSGSWLISLGTDRCFGVRGQCAPYAEHRPPTVPTVGRVSAVWIPPCSPHIGGLNTPPTLRGDNTHAATPGRGVQFLHPLNRRGRWQGVRQCRAPSPRGGESPRPYAPRFSITLCICGAGPPRGRPKLPTYDASQASYPCCAGPSGGGSRPASQS